MARPLRIEYPGAVYHITARGNAGQDIFINDVDRYFFLEILAETTLRYNWLCHAYCLMDNHYHLLLETPDPNLSLGMRQLNGVYTQRFNRQHLRVGHIFQGRYKSILVEKETHLLQLCRYIVLNPVAADIVSHPSEYSWSSYNFTAKSVNKPQFLYIDWLLAQFSSSRKVARKLYRDFVTEGLSGKFVKPWDSLVGQVLLGEEAFVSKIQKLIDEKKDVKEISKLQRFPGRPALAELFQERAIHNKNDRNSIIRKAHLEYGYTLKEIGDYLGIHYSTVSRVIKKE